MNPYSGMPPKAFWRTGVAEEHPLTIKDLYTKKYAISASDWIATAGSCFAQHVAGHLRRRGCNVLDAERPPPGLTEQEAKDHGYLIYSARYGNIYTVRQLVQLLIDANRNEVRDEDIWEKDGRYYDALRPAVEPNGLSSREEVRAHRLDHLSHVRRLFDSTDVFIFTLGLTEAWVHRASDTAYPTCPGVIAGSFDETVYTFKNYGPDEILFDLKRVRSLLQRRNPKMRFLFTVSPVPLTATASGKHVLVATTYSKSTLRSVCGAMTDRFPDVDYFPSYELIASPFSRGFFFEPNMRSVTTGGVNSVMRVFFSEHRFAPAKPATAMPGPRPPQERPINDNDDLVCEERLLEAFQR